uniref:Uncharacterized protein n=1 Tax=Plectus sambesii TaxID=2011161 RepID=A0A914WD97_9BILA
MGKFDGKVIVVTGSSSGIGRGAAVLLAEQGATLTITGRNAEQLEETKKLLLKAGSTEDKILSIIADVTVEDDTKRIIAETVNKFGKLDVLVNNAGGAVACDIGQPVQVFDNIINQNLRSVITLCQAAIPHLKQTKGNIVNISSIAAFCAMTPMAYYCIAKAGLDQLNRILAIDLAQYGIRVNNVNPGTIRTNVMPAAFWDALENEYTKVNTPIPRIGQPIQMAHLISFLANNEESSYITGQCIVADGGLSIKIPTPPIIDFNPSK